MPSDERDEIFGLPGEAADLLRKWKAEADAAIAEAARFKAEVDRRQEAYDLDARAEAWARDAMIAGRRVQ
jgi:hypothetical protein